MTVFTVLGMFLFVAIIGLIGLLSDKYESKTKKQKSDSTPWYEKYGSRVHFTDEDRKTLSQYSDDSWCDLIPFDLQANLLKITIKESLYWYRYLGAYGEWPSSKQVREWRKSDSWYYLKEI